jgi:hypothetical protein
VPKAAAGFVGALYPDELVFPMGQTRCNDFGILIVNCPTGAAHIALPVVAGRNLELQGMATLTAEFHGDTINEKLAAEAHCQCLVYPRPSLFLPG